MRTAVLLTVSVLLGVATCAVFADEPAKGATAIEGKWKVVSSEFEGKSATDTYKRTSIVIDRDELYFTDGFVQSKKQKVKLDPSADPKTIDIGGSKGIYALDKDTLKLCMSAAPDVARPKEFKTKTGDKCNLFVLKREKP